MNKQKAIYYLESDDTCSINFPIDDICPICKTAISPNFIKIVAYKSNNGERCSSFCRCPNCGETYINTYIYNFGLRKLEQLLSSAPNNFQPKNFEDEIKTLSPNFIEIYNQSLHAETMQLDQIAGMGYRKAVEFLIKDFAKSEHPDDEESIKQMPLSVCINNYVDDSKIKNLATKTVWLGNDETHYIRKHTDRDINDLKQFIRATVHFIIMYMIEKDASTISRV